MPKNDIGGFFVSLGLSIDKNSFETGNKLIDGVANSFNKLIGSARNAAVVLAGTAVATGVVESSAYKTASAIGITTEALDVWKASAKIAGVNADGLVNSMSKVGSVLSHIKIDGSGLQEFSKKLGEIGMHMEELKDENGEWLSADKAYEKIIAKGQQRIAEGADRHDIIVKMGDILGGEGQSFFIELLRQQKTIEEFLTGAGKTVFTTAADNQKGADFSVEMGTLSTTMQSISKKLGDEVAGGLTPIVGKINTWIQSNGETITTALENIGSLVETIAQSAIFGDMGKMLSASIKLVAGDKSGALEDLKKTSVAQNIYSVRDINQMLQEYAKDNNIKNYSKLKFEEVPEYIQEALLSYYANGGNKTWSPIDLKSTKKAREERGIDDGIIRPDGTVTKIAPDDWVFAAKNVGDMARAFIPQNYNSVSAPAEYSIVQNFTINGGNDMPQVIRQQAYRGTQEGLLEVMNQSSRRLQLMSGTR